MKRSVIVVNNTQSELEELCSYLKKLELLPIPQKTIECLEEAVKVENPVAIMIDIDSTALDNKSLQRIYQKAPETAFLLISARKSHPDLKEAIGRYVYACISKPLDLDEVEYWLKSILNDVSSTD